MDAYLLKLESATTHVHTASLMTYRRPDDAPADYLQQLFEVLASLPYAATPPFCYRLYRRRRWRNPRWEVVDSIDVGRHLKRSSLPAPGGLAELTAHVQRLHAEPLDLAHPLWECHLIDGLAEGRFAVFLKMHHALADGGTVVRLITSFLSESPEPFSLAVVQAKRQQVRQSAPAQSSPPERPGRWATFRQAVGGISTQFRMSQRDNDAEVAMPYFVPPTPFHCRTGADRVYAVTSLPLTRLRALHQRSGATINDLVLEVCAEALRRYLAGRDALPSRPLVTSIAVALERGEGHADEGNEVAGIMIGLPTHLDEVRERLEFVRSAMGKGKRLLFSMPKAAIELYGNLIAIPFAVTQMTGIGASIPPYWNVVISNVPGPKETLYFHGARLEHMYPCSVIFDGHALNITARGCKDQLNFGLVSCSAAAPDLQRLADYISEGFEHLDAAFRPEGAASA